MAREAAPRPICVGDGTPDVADDPETYIPTARPGARAPHVPLGDGQTTLDLYGHGFVLLNLGVSATDTIAFEAAAASRGVPFETIAIDAPGIQSVYRRRLVLVRPDGHVAWRDDAAPADAGSVLDRARGAT